MELCQKPLRTNIRTESSSLRNEEKSATEHVPADDLAQHPGDPIRQPKSLNDVEHDIDPEFALDIDNFENILTRVQEVREKGRNATHEERRQMAEDAILEMFSYLRLEDEPPEGLDE